MKRLLGRVDPYLLLLWALCIPALAMLFAPGYFYAAHDGRHSVFYQEMFDASLRSGALWPRWAMHHSHGYGYPTFVILAPLGFYLGELFVLAGASFTTAARLAWATGFLVSGWGMYCLVLCWLRRDGDGGGAAPARGALDTLRLAALAAGLLYVYNPYHLLDMVVRGALNDSLLLAWFPWVFLAFDRLIVLGAAPGWTRRLALAVLAFAGTLLTHSFAMLSFTPLLISFVLFRLGLVAWQGGRAERRSTLQRTGLAAAAGVGALLIFTVFLLPLAAELQYLRQDVYVSDTYNYRNHFVFFGQYFSPEWGFGYSDDPDGAYDGMSFQVGAPAAILALAAVYVLGRRGERPVRRAEMLYLLAAALAVLLLMTPLSAPLWDAVPALAVIQFPWRLLALASFALCALGGLTLANLARMPEGYPVADAGDGAAAGGLLAVALLAVFAGASYTDAPLQPVEPWREDGRAVFRFESEHPDMFGYTVWMTEPFTATEMSDEYAAPGYAEVHGYNTTLERLTILQGEGSVESVFSHGSRFGGVVEMATSGVVRVNLAYFPGWQATLDGRPAALRVSGPRGLIELDVPAGEHALEVRMGATPARRAGTVVAWAALAVTAVLLAWPVRRRPPAQVREAGNPL